MRGGIRCYLNARISLYLKAFRSSGKSSSQVGDLDSQEGKVSMVTFVGCDIAAGPLNFPMHPPFGVLT